MNKIEFIVFFYSQKYLEARSIKQVCTERNIKHALMLLFFNLEIIAEFSRDFLKYFCTHWNRHVQASDAKNTFKKKRGGVQQRKTKELGQIKGRK